MWKLCNLLFGWQYVWVNDMGSHYVKRVKKLHNDEWVGEIVLRKFFITPSGKISGAYGVCDWKPLTSKIQKDTSHLPSDKEKRIELKYKYDLLAKEYQRLSNKCIKLEQEKSFVKHRTNDQLQKEEINKLITLCHPDKHGGKKIANDMTAKLISLRGR